MFNIEDLTSEAWSVQHGYFPDERYFVSLSTILSGETLIYTIAGRDKIPAESCISGPGSPMLQLFVSLSFSCRYSTAKVVQAAQRHFCDGAKAFEATQNGRCQGKTITWLWLCIIILFGTTRLRMPVVIGEREAGMRMKGKVHHDKCRYTSRRRRGTRGNESHLGILPAAPEQLAFCVP